MATGDFMDDLDKLMRAGRAAAGTPEKGVPIRGRNFNGTFYVRVDDVVALLEANRVLPKATRLLKGRVTS